MKPKCLTETRSGNFVQNPVIVQIWSWAQITKCFQSERVTLFWKSTTTTKFYPSLGFFYDLRRDWLNCLPSLLASECFLFTRTRFCTRLSWKLSLRWESMSFWLLSQNLSFNPQPQIGLVGWRRCVVGQYLLQRAPTKKAEGHTQPVENENNLSLTLPEVFLRSLVAAPEHDSSNQQWAPCWLEKASQAMFWKTFLTVHWWVRAQFGTSFRGCTSSFSGSGRQFQTHPARRAI